MERFSSKCSVPTPTLDHWRMGGRRRYHILICNVHIYGGGFGPRYPDSSLPPSNLCSYIHTFSEAQGQKAAGFPWGPGGDVPPAYHTAVHMSAVFEVARGIAIGRSAVSYEIKSDMSMGFYLSSEASGEM